MEDAFKIVVPFISARGGLVGFFMCCRFQLSCPQCVLRVHVPILDCDVYGGVFSSSQCSCTLRRTESFGLVCRHPFAPY